MTDRSHSDGPRSDGPRSDASSFEDPSFEQAEIALEIGPDGKIRFEVGGVPGAGCEAIEQVLLAALGSPVESREHTPEFYARRKTGVAGALKAWLGKK